MKGGLRTEKKRKVAIDTGNHDHKNDHIDNNFDHKDDHIRKNVDHRDDHITN